MRHEARSSTDRPRCVRASRTPAPIVLLPEPEIPVNQIVKPLRTLDHQVLIFKTSVHQIPITPMTTIKAHTVMGQPSWTTSRTL